MEKDESDWLTSCMGIKLGETIERRTGRKLILRDSYRIILSRGEAKIFQKTKVNEIDVIYDEP